MTKKNNKNMHTLLENEHKKTQYCENIVCSESVRQQKANRTVCSCRLKIINLNNNNNTQKRRIKVTLCGVPASNLKLNVQNNNNQKKVLIKIIMDFI